MAGVSPGQRLAGTRSDGWLTPSGEEFVDGGLPPGPVQYKFVIRPARGSRTQRDRPALTTSHRLAGKCTLGWLAVRYRRVLLAKFASLCSVRVLGCVQHLENGRDDERKRVRNITTNQTVFAVGGLMSVN